MCVYLQGDLTRSLEGLLNLEKQARVAEDVTASKAACSAVLEVCHKAKDLKQLEEHIVLLAKRRGQLKQVRVCGACSWGMLSGLPASVAPAHHVAS
jgi:26S proteasome regulatory subunit N5